jgi:hypothetical protein
MPIYDLRILLETVEGKKTSYYSSGSNFLPNNFINTAVDGNFMSASMVRDRVRRMVSCSYQNEIIFTGEVVNGAGGSSNYFGKNTNIISASLSGSEDTGSIVFTALDTEYDRLLRYKFIGEKVTNVLGLPSDQWIYVDQVRLPADDEANIFQGNANLGNVNISDTLTFAGGSDVNSDVPILIDTGSDRYIKFVDERAASIVALRMGYDVDADTYEVSGSDDFTFKIGGLNKIQGSVTASTFKFEKNVDGGDATIIIENTNADNGIDKGAGIEFKHRANTGASVNAGKIIAGKDDGYNLTVSPGSGDSNLQFYTTKNNLNFERLRITSEGEARFSGNISASGNIITEGDIIAQNYIVQSTVTQMTTSFSSGSTIFGDTLNDTHQFTGSVFITASNSENTKMGLIVDGNISSSHNIILETISGKLKLNGNVDDDQIYHASAGGIILDSNEGITTIGNLGIGETAHPKALTVAGDISASGDLFKTKFVQMTNSSSVIDTFNTGSFRSAKYTLQVTSASNYQVSELLVLHHNSTASNTEYAQINSGLNLIDFTTDISNSNVRLNAAGSFISCSVRLDRTIIPT